MTVLLRIISPDEWAGERIDNDGEGFVHLSAPHQVLVAANEHYRGRRDLLLLTIDATKLTGQIRIEGGFPHLYGSLTSDAVVGTTEFPADVDGRFQLALVPTHAAGPPAADFVARMVAEMEPLYGVIDGPDMPSAGADEMWAPSGTFLVGWDESGPVCGGGLKRLSEGVAEIKRMYVVPEARGRGHARRLLAGLEDAARRLGYTTVRLDTGPKQPHALALYQSAGYRSIGNYNDNPKASYWGEKSLA